MLSNARAKEVETAQAGVVDMLRKLEESGDIILDEDEAEGAA
jgi:flagellar motor switch protein FliG